MKKLFLLVAAMFAAVSFSACSDDDKNENGDSGDSNLARPALPDANDVCSCMDDLFFMEYCYTFFDVNKDGKVSKTEAAAAKIIDFIDADYEDSRAIKSLKGIGYFVNLEELDCSDTSLTEVDLSQNKKLTSIRFQYCEALERIALPNTLASIEGYAFSDCKSLTSIVIPNSVVTIEDAAFFECESLTSITIPNNVASIGERAFCYCFNLQSFKGKFASSDNRCLIVDDGTLVAFAPAGLIEYTIPNSVTSIGSAVFAKYNNLTSVTIPNSVTSIESYAFYGCNNLKKIYCKPSTPPSLSLYNTVFSSSTTLYVPSKSVDAYTTATGWRYYADQIVGYDFNK